MKSQRAYAPAEPPQWLAFHQHFEYIGIMEDKDIIRALAALAHELRLRVFRMLVVAGPTGLTPGAMAEQLDVPNATLSFHLKELMHAGLVTQERDGRSLIYRAAYDQMNAVLGFLTENCCQGQPCLEPGAASCKC
ncbi:ArsR family transcriptional regulator [Paraburkholderia sp. BL18I3N2]|nr:ArsR family transcriptional regulator [Paraburkholderia sp. BL18I3N2]